MVLSVWLVQGLWGMVSIFLVELVRDGYHVVSHAWPPLMRLHNWHHKAFKKDFTPVSEAIYRKAQIYNDVPESLVMMVAMGAIALLTPLWGFWIGFIYAFGFLTSALARSQGWLASSDLTHEPGELTALPGGWQVNRTYHWRHHFDDTNAYYAGHFTISDKLMGTAVSLKGKTVAVTGASGTLGRALLQELAQQKSKPIALTTSEQADLGAGIPIVQWSVGQENELRDLLKTVDILVINHGLNAHRQRHPAAIEASLEVNALSGWRLMELFFTTVETSAERATKEVWINTSEAEVNPALSPLYEVSKRLIGDLITLRRLDAPCVVRKLILGPFKSNLNPVGVMGAGWVAWAIVALAKRDIRNIVVTINPLTYLVFPLSEWSKALYFRLFTRGEG
ncbi:MAG: bifunctional sterol desaturase/short chain dehydrogenase [Cyanobacteria bacterium Co-bin13]|nr:bifunctional sterol desaturase/short chain dehydrogenase [Cyanobacteria bacterium Co-bin13]